MFTRLSPALTLIAVFSFFWTVIDVSPLRLVSVSPEHLHISSGYTNTTFTCEADGPLTECQFRWRNEIRKKSGPILDLGLGPLSPMNKSYLSRDIIWYHYSGGGLDAGQCGVTLFIKGVKQYTVACRVRAKDSGWRYGHMTLFAENYVAVPVQVPQMQQVAVGEELSVMCKAEKKLNTCRFYLPGFGQVIMDAGRDSPSPSTHQYYGAGLEQGECGLTLKAKETNNGVLWCTVDTSGRDLEWNTIPLIVTRPPDSINLEVTTVPSAPDTDTVFQARCTVSGSRPAANITWLLGDQLLRQDGEDNAANATWAWPYDPQTVTQVVNLTLGPGQEAQLLTCRAHHTALSEPLEASKEVAFDSTQCSVTDSAAVAATCELNGEEISCSSPMVGTIARMTCKPGYVTKGNPINDTRQCQQGGVWDKLLLKCVPDCGRPTNSSDEGTEQEDRALGEFPWHVGIYEQNNESFKYICGGSLISTKFVISGASCFWDSDGKQKKDPELFMVETGKASREWNEEDSQAQRRNVSEIIFHDRFCGFEGQFKFDIALLRLSGAVHVTETVNVVCVDWEGHWERTHLQDNNTGMLVGQGFSDDGGLSESLQYFNLTFIQNSTCFGLLPEDYRHLLTDDKFCAWNENQSRNRSLCVWDVGGGLVFKEPSSDKYYLRGIASVGFQPAFAVTEESCYEQYYIGFTSVAVYLDWINDVVGLFPRH